MINTVTGPIAAADLGFTLMHEHVMVSASGMYRSYPDLLGPNREERAVERLRQAKAAGIDTFVDATTFDLGRDPELLRAVSERSGVNIVNVTGWWLDVPRFIRNVSPNQMAREFVRDIEEGFPRHGREGRRAQVRGGLRGRHAGTGNHEPRRRPRPLGDRRADHGAFLPHRPGGAPADRHLQGGRRGLGAREDRPLQRHHGHRVPQVDSRPRLLPGLGPLPRPLGEPAHAHRAP